MKKNEILQRDVQDAINREPQLNATCIEVNANGGIITLSGFVIYPKKEQKQKIRQNRFPESWKSWKI
ncbi:BON domain-containing protein [Flavobacterium circumlabens]|nr:BON domain-containing protein [Flavobacterium circumlabens]